MRKLAAAGGSLVFLLVAPGVVAVLVPWWLTDWRVRHVGANYWLPVRAVGVALITSAGFVLISAFVRFVIEGSGTPAPVAPTEQLVVGGFYQYVRNPMYVAVVMLIAGEALLLSQPGLLLYAAVVWVACATFVHLYEEPTLTRRFGAQYEAYRSSVPAWWPRLSPWRPNDNDEQ